MLALINIPCFLGDEKYASLEKEIEINFTPFPSLRIAFSCFLENFNQVYREEYGNLLRTASNPTGIIVIETVAFYPKPNRSNHDFYIFSCPIRDVNKEKISAYVRWMKIFYGLTVDYASNFWNEED